MGRMKIIGNTEEETGMELGNIEFETSNAVIYSALSSTVFRNMTHYSTVDGYHRFGGA
jgi:hypothetical protein